MTVGSGNLRVKIPADLFKQFETDPEFVWRNPGHIAGLIRISPEMVQKLGAERLNKALQQSGCELVVMAINE